jgi:hypothetical protein
MEAALKAAIESRRKNYDTSSQGSSADANWDGAPPSEEVKERLARLPKIPNDHAAVQNQPIKSHNFLSPPPRVPGPPPPPPPPPPPQRPQFQPKQSPKIHAKPPQAEPQPKPPRPHVPTEPSSGQESVTWRNPDSILPSPVDPATSFERPDYFKADRNAQVDESRGEVSVREKAKALQKVLPVAHHEPETGDQGPPAEMLQKLEQEIEKFTEKLYKIPTYTEVNREFKEINQRLNDVETIVKDVPTVEIGMKKALHGLSNKLMDIQESVSSLPHWQNKLEHDNLMHLNELGGAVEELKRHTNNPPPSKKQSRTARNWEM